MKIRNRTDFPFAPLLGRVNFPHHSVTCTVRATYALKPDGVVEPLAVQPPFSGDEPSKAERPECLYAADLAPFKPKADVLLRATCHNRKAAPTCMVKFAVGGWSKELAVIGNRLWDKGIVFNKMGEPEPFNTVELTWANAFGGPGFGLNPAGKGRKDGMLPNVEDPAELIKSPGNQPIPAGFGPLDRTWKQRASKLGTYDKKWRKERWPAFPKDLDWTYFNAAPEDQQLEFLRGDEEIKLTNMHPEHPMLKTRLPGMRMRCVVRRREKEGLSEHDVPMNLDTLHVDAHKMLVTLVWRGVCNIREEEGEDVADVLVFSENLADAYATIEQVRPWFEDPPADAQPVPPTPVVNTAADVMEGEALASAIEQMAKQSIAQVKGMSPAQYAAAFGMAPAIFEGFGDMRKGVKELMARMRKLKQPVPADLMKLEKDLDNPDVVAAENDMLIAQALMLMPAAAAPVKGALAKKIKAGEHPAERDFAGHDLSGEDLSGADLSRGNFTGANLAGANLAGCKLDDALFNDADLSGANLSGTSAERVSFVSAKLIDADLSGAKYKSATFDRAQASGLRLAKAEMPGASFADAVLVGLIAEEAKLKAADFSRAELKGAKFGKAELVETVLNAAKAEGADFKAAKAAGMRAIEANLKAAAFEEAELAGGIFSSANLEDANFRFAQLKGALFVSANLHKAVLFGAVVRQASLRKANLSNAQAGNADFFQCDFEKANLSGASLITSNCFEAAFRDANTSGADLTNTNVKMTLLA
jgi:uncharacterized protein YjbI with pentapeptide repeats